MQINYINMDTKGIYYKIVIGTESFEYSTGLGWYVEEWNKKTGKRNSKPANSKYTANGFNGGWIELPTESDILECLYSDSEAGKMSFNEFCSEFGYDNDSIKALDTYRACMATTEKISKLERAGLVKRPIDSEALTNG